MYKQDCINFCNIQPIYASHLAESITILDLKYDRERVAASCKVECR